MRKMKKKHIIIISIVFVILFIILFLCLKEGVFFLNNPSFRRYPIRGVDVSAHQGQIDWEELASSEIQFAFLKATEGKSYVDPYFQQNFEQANQTELKVGAYHFFRYDSTGQEQAEHFIKTVPKQRGNLAPVIDIEFYGNLANHPPDKTETKKELTNMIELLEEHYGVPPILYATMKSYHLYLQDDFSKNPIWIRNVFYFPKLKDKRNWSFWQYTDKAKLEGYNRKRKIY